MPVLEAVAAPRRGNPGFGKKQAPEDKSLKKGVFEFVMTQDFLAQKPRDKDTGEVVDNPYPHTYVAPNSGVAWNDQRKEQESWRFLHGYNSIWEKDQLSPAPSKERLMNVDGKNDIIFHQGHLKVQANEEAKFQALMVQDICEDNENKINEIPTKYRLIDESKAMLKVREDADNAYLAEKTAREASVDEMLPIAVVFGIDIEHFNDHDVRTQFIMKAKEHPATFISTFNDPRNKIKFLVTKALGKGVLMVEEGKLKYAETGVAVLSVDAQADIASQVSSMAMSGDGNAKKLYESLKALDM